MICFLLALATFAFDQPSATPFQGRVSGVVVDHVSHRPLNHVLVEIAPLFKGAEESSMLTSADGAFLFDNVVPGKYQLTAQRRGQPAQAFRGDGVYGTAIVVGPNEVSQNLVFSMRAPASIRGLLLDDEGNALLNAGVLLLRQMIVEGESTTTVLAQSSSDSSGQFHFSHLDAGNYYLAAQGTPGGMQPSRTVYPVTFYGDTKEGEAARVIHLAEGDSVQVQINLHAAPTIELHLPEGTTGNVAFFVSGPQGARVPVNTTFQTTADIYTPSAGSGATTRLHALTVPTYSALSGLAAGRYLITFHHFEPGTWKNLTAVVDVDQGMTITEQAAASSTVKGRLTFDKPPGNGAQLLLYSAGEVRWQTEVTSQGTFNFGKVDAGIYELSLPDPNYVIASISAEGARLPQGELQIPPDGSVELAVTVATRKSLSSLDGFAKNETGQNAGAMVLLAPQDLGRSGLFRRDQSDSDGSFSLHNILPGRYTLIAIDDGHDLPYKNQRVLQAYLAKGVSVSIPLENNQPVNVPVQKRLQ